MRFLREWMQTPTRSGLKPRRLDRNHLANLRVYASHGTRDKDNPLIQDALRLYRNEL